jgi:hypothetical protein
VASEAWDRVEFSGALSPDCAERSFSRVLLKPASYAYGTFVQLWRQLGGEFTGKLRVEPSPPDAKPFSTFDSLSLAEIIRLTNKFSSNLMARHLLLTIGSERFGAPATLEKGAATLTEWGARARRRSAGRGHRQWLRFVAQHAHLGHADGEGLERGTAAAPSRPNSWHRCRSPVSTARCAPE